MVNVAANDVNRVKIADAGGITAIAGGMREYEEDAGVKVQGCRALNNLSSHSAANKEYIRNQGGLDFARKA